MADGSSWAEDSWRAEAGMFGHAAKVVLTWLASRRRIVVGEELIRDVYPELAGRMRPERGWWNPLVSPYTVYSFYSQATLVVSPARDPGEFERLHGAPPGVVEELVREGALIVVLSSPHYRYTCGCFERLLEAQGSLPTTLRLTETLKAVLSRVRGGGPWDTRAVFEALSGSGLGEEDARDLATRLSDLAAFGYRRLAESLLEELAGAPSREKAALARSLHHIMVEPVVDSGGTFAVFSRDELELARRLTEAPGLSRGHVGLLVSTLWRMKAEARLRVPRRLDSSRLLKMAHGEAYKGLHDMVFTYRKLLSRDNIDNDALEEAARLARDIASQATSLHRPATGSKRLALLGLVAQAPVQALFSEMSTAPGGGLLESMLGLVASFLAEKSILRIVSHLLERDENVYVLPVTPALYEAV